MTLIEAPPTVSFRLNGEDVSVRADHPHLLAALREELGVTSPKDGCAPSGQCGCCTVLVNGRALVSCQVPLTRAKGREITTVEGLDPVERDRLARGFAATGALQCGFCTPGIVIRTKALIDQKGSALDRRTINGRLGAHLCRCTGYTKIVEAIELLASGEPIPSVARPGGVGKNGAKYEAIELSLGDRPYIDDLASPMMLHAALRLTDHSRADVLAINTSPAEAYPGVVRVITAADVPGELRVGLIHKDWPVFIPVGGRTSYSGDVLAMVVAGDVQTAREAAELIKVEYRVLTPISDPEQALCSEDAVWELDGNLLSRSVYERGDVEDALSRSAHTIHEVFAPSGWSTLSWSRSRPWRSPSPTATSMSIREARECGTIATRSPRCWGWTPLGSPWNWSPTGAPSAARRTWPTRPDRLGAHLLGRSVKCTLTREESLHIHPKRHPIRIEIWAGCDAEGKLTALKARMLGDSGPYASVGMKVLERAAGHASGPM